MRIKLFLLLAVITATAALAQNTGLRGVVVNAQSGAPVAGATIMLDNQGVTVTTGPSGDFTMSNAQPGRDLLVVLGYGYKDWSMSVEIVQGAMSDVGVVRLDPMGFANEQSTMEFEDEAALTESQLEDEEGNTQAVGTLTGATDNPFYQASSYKFSVMRFRQRGYNSEYASTSINGLNFNDAVRGRFNYSMIGGMNQAFKNKSIGVGLDATSYSFGQVGGANNISTYAKDYSPGFRGAVAYTNGSYEWRGMVTYSTGLRPDGWAFTLSAIGRYADEGIVPGSFYHSAGYFIAAQKVFNEAHSLAITTFGAPTRRASNSAVVQEAYDLAGSNLYNPNWGWQDGKKRNAKVVE